VRFEKTAVVNGEIVHEVFSVEEGARINAAMRSHESDEMIVNEYTKPASLPSIEKLTSTIALGA
jgi:hypothetical protein